MRGANVMDGYYKDEEATKQTIEDDGWMHTGDLGVIDDEGYIYIRGRIKSVIIGPSGQNIYPEEIEAKLDNLPYIQESLVVEKNQRLIALVYPDLERVDAEGISEHQLRERMDMNRKTLNKTLPAYSTISQIELYPEEFEKTPTRKIKRFLHESPV